MTKNRNAKLLMELYAPITTNMINCPVHNIAWKVVPAGVSKSSGKPYSSFKACSVKGCDQKPPREQQTAQTASPAPSSNSLEILEEMRKQNDNLATIIRSLTDIRDNIVAIQTMNIKF